MGDNTYNNKHILSIKWYLSYFIKKTTISYFIIITDLLNKFNS